MVVDNGSPESRKIPKAWTKGRKEKRSCERAKGTKIPLLDSAERDKKCPR